MPRRVNPAIQPGIEINTLSAMGLLAGRGLTIRRPIEDVRTVKPVGREGCRFVGTKLYHAPACRCDEGGDDD